MIIKYCRDHNSNNSKVITIKQLLKIPAILLNVYMIYTDNNQVYPSPFYSSIMLLL